jgi:hypothetical protein
MTPTEIVSFGTFVVLAVSAILTYILPWYRSPKLAIEFRDDEPYRQPSNVNLPPNLLHDPSVVPGHWFRVQVKNIGKKNARNVIGQITEIRDSERKLRLQTKPMRLIWSREEEEHEKSPCLRPGQKAILDITRVVDKPQEKILIRTDENLPVDEWQLKRGTYFIIVEVYADDAKPAKSSYKIVWEKAGIENIHMKQIRRLRNRL